MANCGCSGVPICACVLQAGDNITLEGTGQSDNPWIISANQDVLDVLDTATVDLDLSGASPPVLTANVNIDPNPGNLIDVTAQGLRLDCADVQTCFTPGDGISIVGGLVSVCLSLDANNVATIGSDGCLYVPDQTAGPAVVVLDPAATNILTQGPNGLLGDIITGCGLSGEGNAASPLVVGVTPVFPLACGVANGGNVYCDPVSGRLKTDAPHFRIFSKVNQQVVNASVPITVLDPVGGGASQVGLNTVYNVVNPSPCRTMILHVTAGIQHALFRQPPGTGNGRFEVEISADVVLSAPAVLLTSNQAGHQHWAHGDDASGNRAAFDTTGAFGHEFYSVPPGGVVTVTMRAFCETIQATSAAEVSGWFNTAIIEGWTI